MEIAKPLGIAVSFGALLMIIIYIGSGSITATEISRSAHLSDTIHQAIESLALDVLINNIDPEAKKDFISIVRFDKIPEIEQQIRDGIEGYMNAFPDVALNYETGTKSVADCLIKPVNLDEASTTQLGGLKIEVYPGDYKWNAALDKYQQTEEQLPSIRISTTGSLTHPSAMPHAIVAYYIPPARQVVGPTLLPIAFQVRVETRFLFVGTSGAQDIRDKIGDSSNSSSGKKDSNNVDGSVKLNHNEASDVNSQVNVPNVDETPDPNTGMVHKKITDGEAAANFQKSAGGW